MSQKFSIVGVKHHGAPVYLGEHDGNSMHSSNPYRILHWMCDGYRARFNQHRSLRKKYLYEENETTGEVTKTLIPIGHTVDDFTDKQAREEFSFLASMPSFILEPAGKRENSEWFAATKRRKTLKSQGVNPGSMPRFKSRHKNDQTFTCWFNGGRNAVFEQTGKKTGVVIITGANLKANNKDGHKSRWKIVLRIRLHGAKIRKYTSVSVNTTNNTIVFTNEPESCKEFSDSSSQNSGSRASRSVAKSEKITGVDRGGVVPVSTNHGDNFVFNKSLVSSWEKKAKFHQSVTGKMRSRAENEAKKAGKNPKTARREAAQGRKYSHHRERYNHYMGKISRYREAFAHEITTGLVRDSDVIVLEDLKVKNMTKNGGGKKKGMNRVFLSGVPGKVKSFLEYKALYSSTLMVFIPPHNTSRRCNECHYTHKDNRKSQALFLCQECGHSDNADSNAAKNIADFYSFLKQRDEFWGTDLSPHEFSCVNDVLVAVRLKPSKEDSLAFYKAGQQETSITPTLVLLHT